jgi:hypothetical protein
MLTLKDCLKGTFLAAGVMLVEPRGASALASTVLIESQALVQDAALVKDTIERARRGRILSSSRSAGGLRELGSIKSLLELLPSQ